MQVTRPAWAHARRDGERSWRVAGTVVAVLAALVGLLALLAHAIPTTWQPTVILAAGAHYPMWAAAVAVPIALLVHRWALAAVALLLTVVVLFVQAPTWIGATPPEHGTRITVMQANQRLGSADPTAVVERVRTDDVTMLTTEELTEPEESRLISDGLSTLLPYHFTVASTPNTGNGIGLWSRYPLSRARLLPGFDLKVVTAHVDMPGQPFVAVAAHILPPWPQQPPEWARELSRLNSTLHAMPAGEPVVVGGDFNSTVDMAQFRALLSDGYADGAAQAGAGYTRTYPADHFPGPVIAIDHVLTRDAVATSMSTIPLPGSDHRGLISQVVLRSDG